MSLTKYQHVEAAEALLQTAKDRLKEDFQNDLHIQQTAAIIKLAEVHAMLGKRDVPRN